MSVPESLLLARAEVVTAYEKIRRVLREAGLRGNDLILFSHPIKAPFLEIYDSLGAMATEIEDGKWDA